MNGARAAERVREDREKILSLRKVFVSGPLYTASGVEVGSLGEVERLRYCVIVGGIRRLNLPVYDKSCPQGREVRDSERCMEERMEKQTPEPRSKVTCENQKIASCQARTGDLRMAPGIQAHN